MTTPTPTETPTPTPTPTNPTLPARPRRHKVLLASLIAAALLVAGIGMGAVAAGGNPDTDRVNVPQSAQPAPEPEPAPDPELADPDADLQVPEEDPEPAEVAIGDTFTYEDGLQVAVLRVRRAPISEVGSGGNPARHDNLVLTVKITATEKTTTDLSVTSSLFYGKDGRAAESVFDTAGYGGIETDHMQETPDRLRKGRSVTGEFGFAIPKGAKTDIVFTFAPGWDYSDATFTGRA
jgi:hypothetical protein